MDMKPIRWRSISRNLYVIVLLAILPALGIILYSGLEQRQHYIEHAKKDVLLLTQAMAESQKDIAHSVRQVLTTLSLIPEIQNADRRLCRDIFRAVMKKNPNYINIALTDLNGDILTSGKPLTMKNLGDRKHVRGVLERVEFSIGEYIISRIGAATPAFAFAYPVLDNNGKLKSVLTTAIRLSHISDFHDISNLPEYSFVAVTDHKGTRLFYYPPKESTNPVGKQIKMQSWDRANKAREPEIFIDHGSDGIRRIFAFVPVRFETDDTPYLFVWTGTPEAYVVAPANEAMVRNLLLLIIATVMSLLIAWLIGKKTLLYPIQNLVNLTRKFAQGNLEARSELAATPDEFGMLTKVFHDMADTLIANQKTLREREEKYRLLTENATDVIWTMDMDLNFTYISPAIERIQGWSEEDVASLTINNVLTPQSIEKILKRLESHVVNCAKTDNYNISDRFELELYCKEGTTIWAEISASFIQGEDGKPVGILGVSRDITERKKLESQLRRAQKMEAIGTLAGGVAHDLNNVLSAQVSYPELILMDLPEDSKLRKPILTIQESGKKAAAIVQDLLTLARRGVVASEVVNLNHIVNDYIKSPEHERLKKFHDGVRVETDLEPYLLNIMGSSVHLSNTVVNIVSNAAEAIPGNGSIFISTQSKYIDKPIRGYDDIKEGDYVVLSVSDTGVGISSDDLDKIFEPFYTKKVMGRRGSGLGMAVVWGTVKDHKGYIDVQSTEGKGTTFSLYFPVTRKGMGGKEESLPMEQYMGNGEFILVVDDVEEQREIAVGMLNRLGYAAASVSSGEEAIGYLKKNSADLLVLDMIMDPGIDGLDTFKNIMEFRPDQKAIIASGFSETSRVKEVEKLGAGKYIKNHIPWKK
jgi:PAS domain S-box-containing protein